MLLKSELIAKIKLNFGADKMRWPGVAPAGRFASLCWTSIVAVGDNFLI